jgi:uncharacterized membrane-anchored protein
MNKNQDKIIHNINQSLWIIGIFSLLSSILFFVAFIKLHLLILLIAVFVILCSLPILLILAAKMKRNYISTKAEADKLEPNKII